MINYFKSLMIHIILIYRHTYTYVVFPPWHRRAPPALWPVENHGATGLGAGVGHAKSIDILLDTNMIYIYIYIYACINV